MDSLPDELISQILVYAMETETFVDLEHIFQAPKSVRPKHLQKSGRYANVTFVSSLLNLWQQAHVRDWLAVNSTCRRWRRLGKPLFFASKTFLLTPSMLDRLCAKTAAELSIADQITAQEHISRVVVPMSFYSAGSMLQQLPTFCGLERLKKLSLLRYGLISSMLAERDLNREPLPEELRDLLRQIGMRVEDLDMGILYDGRDEGVRAERRRYMIRALAEEAYPVLRHVAAIKGRGLAYKAAIP